MCEPPPPLLNLHCLDLRYEETNKVNDPKTESLKH